MNKIKANDDSDSFAPQRKSKNLQAWKILSAKVFSLKLEATIIDEHARVREESKELTIKSTKKRTKATLTCVIRVRI